MSIDIDKAFGIFPQALNIHEKRAEIIANNLANQDTPGYKAQDIPFKEALARLTEGNDPRSLATTHKGHISNANNMASEYVQYRVAHQPSLDGNTVDGQIEQSEFSNNAMRYIANLTFLSGKIKGIMTAIKGGTR